MKEEQSNGNRYLVMSHMYLECRDKMRKGSCSRANGVVMNRLFLNNNFVENV